MDELTIGSRISAVLDIKNELQWCNGVITYINPLRHVEYDTYILYVHVLWDHGESDENFQLIENHYQQFNSQKNDWRIIHKKPRYYDAVVQTDEHLPAPLQLPAPLAPQPLQLQGAEAQQVPAPEPPAEQQQAQQPAPEPPAAQQVQQPAPQQHAESSSLDESPGLKALNLIKKNTRISVVFRIKKTNKLQWFNGIVLKVHPKRDKDEDGIILYADISWDDQTNINKFKLFENYYLDQDESGWRLL